MTNSWNGIGLPPVAAQRVERAARSTVATSLLSAPAAAAAAMADLVPVGEVFGAAVVHLGWAGFGNCGYIPPAYGQLYGTFSRATFATSGGAGFQPYIRSTRRGYAAALDRLSAEAAAMRADGVVGIRIEVVPMGNENYEFTALGTAMRFSTGAPEREKPFRTELSAVDVLALVKAGWLPTDVVFGIGIEIMHDDWNQRMQAASFGNTEITNLSRLTAGANYEARYALHDEARASGASGVLLSARDERIWEQEQGNDHRDHVAEVRIRGTGIASFGTHTHRPALTVLPVRP